MPNPTPSSIFGPNFTSNTDDKTLTFTYANPAQDSAFNLYGITNSTVDPNSGDARTIIYALLERICEWYEGVDVDARPTNFRVTRSGTLANTNGEVYIRRSYSIEMKAEAGALNLISEE